MSQTALPLPLELTKPVTLASDLDTLLRESLGVGKYDPKLQITMRYGAESESEQESESQVDGSKVIDVTIDFQVDDNSFN